MDDSYDGDDFEQSTHKAKTLKGMALSGAHLDDDDSDAKISEQEEESKEQYDYGGEQDAEMAAKIQEQEKTIQFQKAKIAAL